METGSQGAGAWKAAVDPQTRTAQEVPQKKRRGKSRERAGDRLAPSERVHSPESRSADGVKRKRGKSTSRERTHRDADWITHERAPSPGEEFNIDDTPKKKRSKSKERTKDVGRDEISGEHLEVESATKKRKKGTTVSRDDSASGWKSGRVLGSITSMARRSTTASGFAALKGSITHAGLPSHGAPSQHSLPHDGSRRQTNASSGSVFAHLEAQPEDEPFAIPKRAGSDSKMATTLTSAELLAPRKTFIGTTKIHLDDGKTDATLQRISSVHDRNLLPTVVIVGSQGIGKTALVDTFFQLEASELFPAGSETEIETGSRYGRVVLDGMDVVCRVIELPATTASQLEALSVLGGQVSLVVLYSIADVKSLPIASSLIRSTRELFASWERPCPGIFLVANQIDLLGAGDLDMASVFRCGRETASEFDCKFVATTTKFSKTNAKEIFLCALYEACADLSHTENSFVFDDGHRVSIEDFMSVLVGDEWIRRYCAVKGEFLIEMDGQEPIIRYLSVCVPKRIGSCMGMVAWMIRLPSGAKVTFGTDSPEKMNQWVDIVSRKASGRGQADVPASPRGIVGEFSTLLAIATRMHCVDCGDSGCTWVSHHYKTYLCTACADVHKTCLKSPPSGITTLETYSNKPVYWSCFYALCNEHFNMVWQATAPGTALLTPSASPEDREQFILAKYRDRSFYNCRGSPVLMRPYLKGNTMAAELDVIPSPRGHSGAAGEWKPRYLYLSPGGLLSINKDTEREVLLDTFHISCTSIVEGRKLGFGDLHMQLIGPHSSYLVKAETEEDAQYWLTILSSSFLRTKGRSNVIQLDGFSVPASCFSRASSSSTPSILDEDLSLDKVYSLLQLKMSLWSNQLQHRHTMALKQSLEQKLQETIQQLREIDDTERKILSRVSRLEPTSIREEVGQLRNNMRRAGDFLGAEDSQATSASLSDSRDALEGADIAGKEADTAGRGADATGQGVDTAGKGPETAGKGPDSDEKGPEGGGGLEPDAASNGTDDVGTATVVSPRTACGSTSRPNSLGADAASVITHNLDSALAETALLGGATSQVVIKEGLLVAAALEQLSILACQPGFESGRCAKTLLMTFPNFVGQIDLLRTWCKAFAEPVAVNMDRDSPNFGTVEAVSSASFARALRKKILRNVGTWLEEYWRTDFLNNERLIITVLSFVDDVVDPLGGYFEHVQRIRELVQTQVELSVAEEHVTPASRVASDIEANKVEFPRAILPKHGLKAGATAIDLLMEMDTLELARQLTLLQHELFCNVPGREFLKKRWMASDKEVAAPNVIALTKNFNDLSSWVSSVVLGAARSRVRAKVIDACVTLGVRCAELQNFHAVIAIVGGLQDPAVRRLAKSWALVQGKSFGLFQDLVNRMSVKDNWAGYRLELAEATTVPGAAVPFIGVFLKDLVFIFDGISDKETAKDGTELINFAKQRKIGSILKVLEKLQGFSYEFQPVPQVTAAWVQALERVSHLDEGELFEVSCKLEPRVVSMSVGKRKDTIM